NERSVERIPEASVFAGAGRGDGIGLGALDLARTLRFAGEQAALEFREEPALALDAEFGNEQGVALRLQPHIVFTDGGLGINICAAREGSVAEIAHEGALKLRAVVAH